jgi:hypothetical protein
MADPKTSGPDPLQLLRRAEDGLLVQAGWVRGAGVNARKYSGRADRVAGGELVPRQSFASGWEPEPETVSAYDARDVEPLLTALRHAQEVVGAESVSAGEEVGLLAHIGEALEPFASQSEEGQR